MRRTPLLLGACLLASAFATDRYFPDLEARSPGGRYRARAVSPDNAGGQARKAFQANFTYSLFDANTYKVLWTRKQPMVKFEERWWPAEPSPVGLFVNDEGWVVIWLEDSLLVAVNPRGQDTGRIDILEKGVPQSEMEEYTHWTTGGLAWGAGSAHFYFIPKDGRTYFCGRCWWGRRIVFDLPAGTHVKDFAFLDEDLKRHETSFVLETLRSAAAEKEGEVGAKAERPDGRATMRAAHMAGVLGIKDAVPFLSRLENSPYEGSYWGFRQDYPLRSIVQLSLRRLGAKPRLYPVSQWSFKIDGEKEWLPVSPPSEPREKQVEKLKIGQTPYDVIALLGAPDLADHRDWQYEIDAPEPYSIRITWKSVSFERNSLDAVASVTRNASPLWKSSAIEKDIF